MIILKRLNLMKYLIVVENLLSLKTENEITLENFEIGLYSNKR